MTDLNRAFRILECMSRSQVVRYCVEEGGLADVLSEVE